MAAEPVTASIHVAAPPEVVYRYFTRPAEILGWMGEWARLDARPGGPFALNIRGAPVRGRFMELEEPHRIVMSWGYAGSETLPPGTSIVEVRLVEQDDGTLVELEHRDLPAPEATPHAIGWAHYLARLELAAAGGDPGSDPGMTVPAGRPA
jgi:uncharacterized protein YndB with AHSA1/START domain